MTPSVRHLARSAERATLAVLFLALGIGPALGQATSSSFALPQATFDAAGTTATSASFVLDGSAAQSATVGETSSASYVVQSGFWTSLSTLRLLRVAAAGSGDGAVDGPGIACTASAGTASGDCGQGYADGRFVELVATPDAGNAFDAWSGCDATATTTLTGDTCQVTIGDGRTVSAKFTVLRTVSGRVWRDVDGVGDQDPSEPGLNAIGITLTNQDDVTFDTTTAADGTYAFADIYPGEYVVLVDPLTLPAGAVPSYDLDGIATPHRATIVVADGEDRDDVHFGYQPQTNLQISKVDDVADGTTLPGGERLTYTITVENLGVGIATGVEVTDVLPIGTTLVATVGCAEDPAGAPTCSLGTIDVGLSKSFTIEVSIDPDPGPSITNTASVAALEVDPQGGDNSASETTQLDDDAPAILTVDADHPTADLVLEPCETVHAQPVEGFRVELDEPMWNPAGDTTAGDITNPAAWQLVAAGPDLEVDTVTCGAPADDDVAVPIVSVVYDDATRTASLATVAPLAPGLYLALTCGDGEAGLRDRAGNRLDGDGDGFAGGDFTLRFRADPDNLLANGQFDCDLREWQETSADDAEIAWADVDVDGSPDSGSSAIENLTGSLDFALGQCLGLVAAGEPTELELSAVVRLETDAAGIGVVLGCTFFTAADCTGTASAPATASTHLYDTGSTWIELWFPLTAPATTQSAWCSVDWKPLAGEGFDARLDEVRLVAEAGRVFADGFESGDTSEWSSTTP